MNENPDYILIKEYPHSPPLGTIFKFSHSSGNDKIYKGILRKEGAVEIHQYVPESLFKKFTENFIKHESDKNS